MIDKQKKKQNNIEVNVRRGRKRKCLGKKKVNRKAQCKKKKKNTQRRGKELSNNIP